MNIIMSSFCFLSVHTASPFGHIDHYASSTTDTLPSKQIQKTDSGNY